MQISVVLFKCDARVPFLCFSSHTKFLPNGLLRRVARALNASMALSQIALLGIKILQSLRLCYKLQASDTEQRANSSFLKRIKFATI